MDETGDIQAEGQVDSEAEAIDTFLRTGWYSPVHVKSIQSHQIRALLSSRKEVLTKCVDLENEIRGLFKVFGIKLSPKLGHGSFDRAVRETIKADPTRFKRSRTVAAHFGLTPRRFQSGEMDKPGHISRAGDPQVRCTLPPTP